MMRMSRRFFAIRSRNLTKKFCRLEGAIEFEEWDEEKLSEEMANHCGVTQTERPAEKSAAKLLNRCSAGRRRFR